jgi:hypothetical protein
MAISRLAGVDPAADESSRGRPIADRSARSQAIDDLLKPSAHDLSSSLQLRIVDGLHRCDGTDRGNFGVTEAPSASRMVSLRRAVQ